MSTVWAANLLLVVVVLLVTAAPSSATMHYRSPVALRKDVPQGTIADSGGHFPEAWAKAVNNPQSTLFGGIFPVEPQDGSGDGYVFTTGSDANGHMTVNCFNQSDGTAVYTTSLPFLIVYTPTFYEMTVGKELITVVSVQSPPGMVYAVRKDTGEHAWHVMLPDDNLCLDTATCSSRSLEANGFVFVSDFSTVLAIEVATGKFSKTWSVNLGSGEYLAAPPLFYQQWTGAAGVIVLVDSMCNVFGMSDDAGGQAKQIWKLKLPQFPSRFGCSLDHFSVDASIDVLWAVNGNGTHTMIFMVDPVTGKLINKKTSTNAYNFKLSNQRHAKDVATIGAFLYALVGPSLSSSVFIGIDVMNGHIMFKKGSLPASGLKCASRGPGGRTVALTLGSTLINGSSYGSIVTGYDLTSGAEEWSMSASSEFFVSAAVMTSTTLYVIRSQQSYTGAPNKLAAYRVIFPTPVPHG